METYLKYFGVGLKPPNFCIKYIDRPEAALSYYKYLSVAASVLYSEYLKMVSQKTRLVECGIFQMVDPGSATVTVYFRVLSN